ncbi:MAG: MoxR family ATPase, partial [Thaumarchaeota archaeon]|nr:MoxR family ATPase [Candidatus Calditenuaceae archaeon]
MTPHELASALEARGLYYPAPVTRTLAALLKMNPHAVRAVLLRGPAGVGKTALTYAIAELLSADYIYYQATLSTSEDDLMYKLLPSEQTRSGVEKVLGPLPEALLRSRENVVVLVLDEYDKTRPSADALLLDFLQHARLSVRMSAEERIITGRKENLIVFLTSNDEREFSEPLFRRCVTITI